MATARLGDRDGPPPTPGMLTPRRWPSRRFEAVRAERTNHSTKNWRNYFDWMKNIRAGCVSRQPGGGIRTAWYGPMEGLRSRKWEAALASARCYNANGQSPCRRRRIATDPRRRWEFLRRARTSRHLFSSALCRVDARWTDRDARVKRFYKTLGARYGFDIIFFGSRAG